MSLTPLDIHHKEFHRSIRGYNEEEVDVFLDQVADEFERMFNHNRELQEKVEKMQDKVEQYEGLEQTLQKAILTAQQAADDVQLNAQKESELIVKDAELKAKEIIQDIADKKEEIKGDLHSLKNAEKEFRSKFKGLLKSYLQVIKKIESGERPEPAAKAPPSPPTPKKNEQFNAKPRIKEETAKAESKTEAKPDNKMEVKIEPKVAPMPMTAPGQDKGREPAAKEKETDKADGPDEGMKDKKLQTQQEYNDYFNESSFFSDEEGTKKQQNTEPERQNSDKQKNNNDNRDKPANQASSETNPIEDNVLESDQPIRYDYPEIEMEPKNMGSSQFSSYFADDMGDSGAAEGDRPTDNSGPAGAGPDSSGINEIS